jgi:mRNA interferase RelE/StbE
MAAYSILFKESVRKDIGAIPVKELQRIMERIDTLAGEPRPPGSEKFSGQERYRIRQGNYRIIYSIQDNELTVWVVKVGHRREVYRGG